MKHERLRAVLGREPHTPWDEAVEATLLGLGCLQERQRLMEQMASVDHYLRELQR